MRVRGDSAAVQQNWLANLAGRFLVFDGPDGSGKTSQYRRFIGFVRQHGAGLGVCEVREPGGTGIGEKIRDVLLDPANVEMSLRTEMLLYMASRCQLVHERIAPALARGDLVLADRFISSTLAYQGTAGGLLLEDILAVGRIVCQMAEPDLVIVFDVDDRTAAKRLNPLLDRMEAKGVEYHRLVRQGFLDQAELEPARYLIVDATLEEDAVFDGLLASLEARLGTWGAVGPGR